MRRGIEVYLDVVFNHTAEGGDDGPTYNFRGVDNTLYLHAGRAGPLPELTAGAATRSAAIIRWSAITCSTACGTGSRRGASTASGSTWPRCWVATGTATCWSSRRSIKRISEDSLLRDTQADRRALGRGRALPGRHLSRRGPLVGLERPLSRRRPALLARRTGHDLGPGHPALRQRRPLRGPRAAALDQLHLLPRRIHAQRPGLLQPQAQRGQRRGEPRRQRRQLELELRRRGADRRSRRSSRLRGAAGPQPDGHADDLARASR